MKISRKKLLLLLSVVALLIGGVVSYVFILGNNDDQPQDRISSETTASTEPVEPVRNENDEATNRAGEPIKPDTQTDVIVGTASVTLSFIEQQGSNIIARAYASADSKGACELKLSKGSESYTKSSDSNLQTSYYQCEGFEFSANDLPSSGTWNAKVVYVDGSGLSNESNELQFEVQR
jgi:hypothetical protein